MQTSDDRCVTFDKNAQQIEKYSNAQNAQNPQNADDDDA
jgi:hypothetical protein